MTVVLEINAERSACVALVFFSIWPLIASLKVAISAEKSEIHSSESGNLSLHFPIYPILISTYALRQALYESP